MKIYLIYSNNVGQEREGLDLCGHKVNVNFFVKRRVHSEEQTLRMVDDCLLKLPVLRSWLKSDGQHDERNEFRDILMDIVLV